MYFCGQADLHKKFPHEYVGVVYRNECSAQENGIVFYRVLSQLPAIRYIDRKQLHHWGGKSLIHVQNVEYLIKSPCTLYGHSLWSLSMNECMLLVKGKFNNQKNDRTVWGGTIRSVVKCKAYKCLSISHRIDHFSCII